MQSETETSQSSIWTLVYDSLSWDDSCYTNCVDSRLELCDKTTEWMKKKKMNKKKKKTWKNECMKTKWV